MFWSFAWYWFWISIEHTIRMNLLRTRYKQEHLQQVEWYKAPPCGNLRRPTASFWGIRWHSPSRYTTHAKVLTSRLPKRCPYCNAVNLNKAPFSDATASPRLKQRQKIQITKNRVAMFMLIPNFPNYLLLENPVKNQHFDFFYFTAAWLSFREWSIAHRPRNRYSHSTGPQRSPFLNSDY